jgi:hypothetical protein
VTRNSFGLVVQKCRTEPRKNAVISPNLMWIDRATRTSGTRRQSPPTYSAVDANKITSPPEVDRSPSGA